MPDSYGALQSFSDPAYDNFNLTPSDSTVFKFTLRGIYVGTSGDVTVVSAGGDTATWKAVPQGMIIPVRATKVMATGTTATNLVGLY